MLVFSVLIIMIGYNLFNVVTQERTVFYRDFRFYLVLVSLGVIIYLMVESYPV